jgi:hypothetical protein
LGAILGFETAHRVIGVDGVDRGFRVGATMYERGDGDDLDL